MWVFGLIALMVAGCGFQHGVASRDGGPGDGPDGPIVDAPPDAFDPLCYGRAPFTICLDAIPTGNFGLGTVSTTGTTTCSSGNGTVMMVGQAPVSACVIAAANISMGSAIVGVSGDKPLVLIAETSITINAGTVLDVTSGQTGDGPGANPTADCGGSASQAAGSDQNGGAGGGAGGSFGARGGGGGPGANGTGGVSDPAVTVPVGKLRGGCRGGSGGDGDAGGPGGKAAGGSGGGVVYLATHGTISIDGIINASGGGGGGGQASKGGGGGGGSGGMIVIHTATLTVGAAGQIFSNGGGGGAGGGGGSSGAAGGDGLALNMAAAGGMQNGGGTTSGGAGGFKSTPAGSATNTGNGGAAGGGGVGVIRVLSGQTIPAGNVSPTPSLF